PGVKEEVEPVTGQVTGFVLTGEGLPTVYVSGVGPGLLVVAGSLIALVATRYLRAEQDRRAFRRHYSTMWG
ncbi:hypothetical protein ACWDTB_34290, partial [Streptomyces sp. NPDC003487]